MVSTGFPSKGRIILIELPVRDVIMHVNMRGSKTTAYFFNDSLSRTEDWVNRPFEILLKSYHTDSSVSYIYC